jgi:hypothetical protein
MSPADQAGLWQSRPSSKLSAGETIRYMLAQAKLETKQRLPFRTQICAGLFSDHS